eukprot:COSAG01_NODE_2559_length_7453_cov_37.838183_3_plen_111_part_00
MISLGVDLRNCTHHECIWGAVHAGKFSVRALEPGIEGQRKLHVGTSGRARIHDVATRVPLVHDAFDGVHVAVLLVRRRFGQVAMFMMLQCQFKRCIGANDSSLKIGYRGV